MEILYIQSPLHKGTTLPIKIYWKDFFLVRKYLVPETEAYIWVIPYVWAFYT